MDTVEPASRGKQYFYDTPVKKWTLRDARLHFDNDDDTDENLKQTLLSLEKSLNSSRAKKARALLKRLKRKHSRRAQKNSSSSPPSTSEHNVTVNINQTYQLQVPANDNDSNSESDSFKSQDHNPKSKKRVHVDIYDDKIDALNTAVDDSDKWFLGNVDLSEYLFDFRRESRDMMADKLDMELCPARLLSLGNIFLFTHRRTHSCISDLPKNLIAEIYASIDGSDDCLAIMPPVNEWIHRVTSIVTKDHANEAEMMIILGQMLVEAASSPSNNDIAIKSANVIFDLTRGFARIAAQVEMFEDKRGAYCEDTFVHQIVAPFLRNIFYGSLLGSHW
ncbi:hypothetical protein BJV82DRAFT_169061 [Fennellomyces sp. T-0311]|nr:hypothetical protein BJV82DRAFT_169061 [Fennellomyces sp. T-0311]